MFNTEGKEAETIRTKIRRTQSDIHTTTNYSQNTRALRVTHTAAWQTGDRRDSGGQRRCTRGQREGLARWAVAGNSPESLSFFGRGVGAGGSVNEYTRESTVVSNVGGQVQHDFTKPWQTHSFLTLRPL